MTCSYFLSCIWNVKTPPLSLSLSHLSYRMIMTALCCAVIYKNSVELWILGLHLLCLLISIGLLYSPVLVAVVELRSSRQIDIDASAECRLGSQPQTQLSALLDGPHPSQQLHSYKSYGESYIVREMSAPDCHHLTAAFSPPLTVASLPSSWEPASHDHSGVQTFPGEKLQRTETIFSCL